MEVSRAIVPNWRYCLLTSGIGLAAMQAMKIMPKRTESSWITSPTSPSSLSVFGSLLIWQPISLSDLIDL